MQETGIAPDDAIAKIAQMRCDTPDGWKRSPETDEQRAFIAMWARRGTKALMGKVDLSVDIPKSRRRPRS